MKRISLITIVTIGSFLAFSFVSKNKALSISSSVNKVGISIGDIAPEIALTSPEGNTLKLSSLRGKYVLIDFWASWCGPCRRENPNVVSAYKKYNKAKFKEGKGFEVFSVSLDNDPERWKTAIDQDKLSWTYHVSDLKGWYSSAAKTYRINSIPSSFLIDPDGKIIAKNLKGMGLHLKLDELVKSF
ncbi:MAG: TlpA family protein disulfide reductase [Flavobacteriales bacterium]|nr:TlpA family protein disulfide reductase [Flavobacteriales bacterium]